MEAAWIGRYFPGMGDPWRLTLGQWSGLIDRLQDVIEIENPGDPHDPSFHGREMARMLRIKRRNQSNG